MSKIGTRLSFAVVALAAMAHARHDANAQRKFTFGYDQPRTTAYGIAATFFEAKLKEVSGGKMSIDQFPGAQLGQEPVSATEGALRRHRLRDHLDRECVDARAAGRRVLAALHLPRQGSSRKTLADPGVEGVPRHGQGIGAGRSVLGLMTMGMRNIYRKKEIKVGRRLKGQKIRVQATKTEDTHFPAYGTQTVHMPFGEVYTSLQTGVVNAAENGINVYLANKHYEVAPVLSITEHEANNNCIWSATSSGTA
jgi:TRAP-type C4-dicarboxylate transport system substrate-binding protein